MMETLVQDYLEAALKMDKQAFAERVGAVLVSLAPALGPSFQQASTQMFDGNSRRRRRELDHRLPVLELGNRFSELRLGRSEENQVVIADETVSARHARLMMVRTSGAILLEDLDSTNGTSLNGRPLLPGRAVELSDGDELRFGDTLFLFYGPVGFYDELRRLARRQAQPSAQGE